MLVDANNVLIRAVRATERSGMATVDGVPTGPLLVFINSLSYHFRTERPDAVVVCWDGGRSRYRIEIFPDYKKDRPKREGRDDPEGPFGLAKRFLSLANLHHVEREGYEADDLIAAYCRQSGGWGAAVTDVGGYSAPPEIIIVSSDHDLLQLLGPGVTQVKVSSRPPDDRWDAARVLRDLGCEPRYLPYVMALQGDPGDGVPGLPRIGPKKAVRMMARHDWSWLRLLEGGELDEDQRGIVQLALRLVDLRDGPGPSGLVLADPAVLSPTAPGDAMFEELLAFLRRYELASVERRLLDGTLWGVDGRVPESDLRT
jgi:DNA polymerase-1